MGQENDYDAIVLDVVLDGAGPGIDGFEVCRALRAGRRWSPVLMVTARDAVRDGQATLVLPAAPDGGSRTS
jgi:two-component system OmpR family response regulator